MNRVAVSLALIVMTAIFSGCAPQPDPTPGPSASSAMPEVTAEPDITEFQPMTPEELDSLAGGTVSGTVDALARRGYVDVVVTDGSGSELEQAQWDFHEVTSVTTDGDGARVVIG